MILKITAKILGNIAIKEPIEVKKRPNIINVFYEEGTKDLMISISRRLVFPEKSIPILTDKNGVLNLQIQHSAEEEDMIRMLQHIESFGAFDVHLQKIDWLNPKYEWIPEDGDTIISPLSKCQRQLNSTIETRKVITQKWLTDTVIYSKMMKDLYIPFSFYREGNNFFQNEQYVFSFASFYWILEYFFYSRTKKYMVEDNACEKFPCLKTALRSTLIYLQNSNNHNYLWLQKELVKRKKSYDESGLLFVINRYRNTLLHMPEKNAKDRVFNDYKYRPIAFISMYICQIVMIKMRLLPFVQDSNKQMFLSQTFEESKQNI